MMTVYGADWCEDTRRTLRHLRRLGVRHVYRNVDEDLDALQASLALNGGRRRTPTIDLGLGGPPLVEPSNEMLTEALVEREMLTLEDAHERLGVQNVGDLERVIRAGAGAALVLAGSAARGSLRWPLRVAGAALALSGVAGWCPGYYGAGVTSLNGPGDRPDESGRLNWLEARRAPGGAGLPDEAAEAAS